MIYTIYLISVENRIKFLKALRKINPHFTISEADIIAKQKTIAVNLTDLQLEKWQSTIGDSAKIEVESHLTQEEIFDKAEQEKLEKARKWYLKLSQKEKEYITLISSAQA